MSVLHKLFYLSGFLFILSCPLDKYYLTFKHSPLCLIILAASKFNHLLHSYHLTPHIFRLLPNVSVLPKYLSTNFSLPQDLGIWSCPRPDPQGTKYYPGVVRTTALMDTSIWLAGLGFHASLSHVKSGSPLTSAVLASEICFGQTAYSFPSSIHEYKT